MAQAGGSGAGRGKGLGSNKSSGVPKSGAGRGADGGVGRGDVPGALLYYAPGQDTFKEILIEHGEEKALQKLKEATELNPIYMMTTRLVHNMAGKIQEQSLYNRKKAKRFETKTQVKLYFECALRRGIRGNYINATDAIYDVLKEEMDEGTFIDMLHQGEHNKLFDRLYARALRSPDEVAMAVNMVAFPPMYCEHTNYVISAAESGDEVAFKEGEKMPKPDNKTDPSLCWFPSKDILMANRARVTVQKEKRARTAERLEKIKANKKEGDEVIRVAALNMLKQCMDGVKYIHKEHLP